jgi:cytochrome c
MNRFLLSSSLVVLLSVSTAAFADPGLAKARNCLACHASDKKLIGPSFKDVSARYANDKDAPNRLARKIREGGVGAWGQIPMPANQQVSPDEALTLSTWILSGAKPGGR